jgi:hypothetical protein
MLISRKLFSEKEILQGRRYFKPSSLTQYALVKRLVEGDQYVPPTS